MIEDATCPFFTHTLQELKSYVWCSEWHVTAVLKIWDWLEKGTDGRGQLPFPHNLPLLSIIHSLLPQNTHTHTHSVYSLAQEPSGKETKCLFVCVCVCGGGVLSSLASFCSQLFSLGFVLLLLELGLWLESGGGGSFSRSPDSSKSRRWLLIGLPAPDWEIMGEARENEVYSCFTRMWEKACFGPLPQYKSLTTI